jgi:hypothetical protein
MQLRFSYGPQVNPLTSLVEVQLDGLTVGGQRLTAVDGKRRDSLRVDLPPERITPHSKMQIYFRFDPRERRSCNRVTDYQLWGTLHRDTQFELKRRQVVKLPNLRLLQAGYPFTAPQDLSRTAIVLPDKPSARDLALLLQVSERLGRLSRSAAVQIQVYPVDQLPPEIREQRHLIGIGLRRRFPLPEVFQGDGVTLQPQHFRQWGQSRVQAFADAEGVMQQALSPWNPNRVVLTLSAQTDKGLTQVTDVWAKDALFSQLDGDTVLISANAENTSPDIAANYTLDFLRQFPEKQIQETSVRRNLFGFLWGNWLLLVPGFIALTLLFYGASQHYLKRVSH